MVTSTIKCPECGGDKTIAEGPRKYKCQYCGATFVNASEAIANPPSPAITTCQYCGGQINVGSQKCRHCGEWLIQRPQSTQFAAQPQYVQQGATPVKSRKSKGVAALLAIIFAGWGVHEFYLGHVGAGLAYLLIWFAFCWTIFVPVVLAIISVIQGIVYLTMSNEQFAAKYQ